MKLTCKTLYGMYIALSPDALRPIIYFPGVDGRADELQKRGARERAEVDE